MNKRILVVDDEQNIRDIISEFLSETGYQVKVAVDGLDALEKIQYEQYDLYIIDVFMPRMDGLQLVEKLKEIQPLAVVVIVTGFSSIDVAIKAIRKGAYHYLTKPIQADELIKVVESGLKYSAELKEEAAADHLDAADKITDQQLLRGFSTEQQKDFRMIGTVNHYGPGDHIPLDEENGSMIWIESGRINVYHNKAIVDTIQEGEIWGEETFINPAAAFTRLIAQSEVQVRQFKRKRIIEFFTYNDEMVTKRYMINLIQSIYLKWRKSIYKIGLYSGFTADKQDN
ncbi:MAG: response regulator [Candidatus Cloacimonadaceae bacterium]|nr:response regulator [Candidatus Cloacimonadaceae bacterium]MDP3113195.1 response regulator [Candidatus Cloacimonadaceae bacterium]